MSPQSSGPRLRALVLGSGAGGGVPQWNCGCRGLPPRLERRQAGQAAHPGRPRAQRRRRELAPAQRLDRSAPADPGDACAPAEGRGAPFADRRRRPDQRRDRFFGRPSGAARAPAARHLRHAGDAGRDRGQSDVRRRRPRRRPAPRRPPRRGLRAAARTQARIVRRSRQGSAVARGRRGHEPTMSAKARSASRSRRGARGSSMRPAAPMLRRTSTPASAKPTCCFSTARCSPTTK